MTERQTAYDRYEKAFDLARYFEERWVLSADDAQREWLAGKQGEQEDIMEELEKQLWIVRKVEAA